MSQPDLRRTLTVVSMSGEMLLDAVEVCSLAELKQTVAQRMGTRSCKPLGHVDGFQLAARAGISLWCCL